MDGWRNCLFLDGNLDERRRKLLEFSSAIIHYRRKHPNFHRRSYFERDPSVGFQKENVRWVRSDGQAMSDKDWQEGGWMRTIGMFLAGTASEIRDKDGKPVVDHDFLLLLNAHHETVSFRVPEDLDPSLWSVVFDTNQPDLPRDQMKPGPDGKVSMSGRSVLLLNRRQK